MYQQRSSPPPPDDIAPPRLWLPEAVREFSDRLGAVDDAWYVVVDDLDDDVAVLVVAPWPEQDAYGRLTFGDPGLRHTWAVAAEGFHDRVTQARSDARQEAADRPLRIGDAFLAVVRGETESEETLDVILDVTRDAREQAKLAYFSAVTPRVDPDYAAEIALVELEEDEEFPPAGPGPSASPAV